MAVGRGRTRRLTVGAQHFRWRCEFHLPAEKHSVGYAQQGKSWKPDTLLIRPEDGPHRLLAVIWPPCEGPLVQPRLVRSCIEEAFRRGWLDHHPAIVLNGPEIPTG